MNITIFVVIFATILKSSQFSHLKFVKITINIFSMQSVNFEGIRRTATLFLYLIVN